jgi:hypothetical protein
MSEASQYSDRLQARAQRASRWAERWERPLEAMTDLFDGDKPLPVRIAKAYLGLGQTYALLIPSVIADKTFEHTLNREVEGLEVQTEHVHVDGGARSVNFNAHYYKLPGRDEFLGSTAVARHIAAEI